jgi:hypothetical protein
MSINYRERHRSVSPTKLPSPPRLHTAKSQPQIFASFAPLLIELGTIDKNVY